MSCCKDIGIIDSCEPINTGETATQTGVYKYVLTMSLGRLKGSVTATEGAPIIIECKLNENAYYKLELTAPNGTKLDCIEFKTRYSLNCGQES